MCCAHVKEREVDDRKESMNRSTGWIDNLRHYLSLSYKSIEKKREKETLSHAFQEMFSKGVIFATTHLLTRCKFWQDHCRVFTGVSPMRRPEKV